MEDALEYPFQIEIPSLPSSQSSFIQSTPSSYLPTTSIYLTTTTTTTTTTTIDFNTITIMSTTSISASDDPILRKTFKLQGVDKRSRPLLQIIASSYHHRSVSVDGLNKYLEARVYPELEKRKFSVLYVNTCVERCENFPGISNLRAICEAVPTAIKANISDVYFLHPGFNSRLFLAAFGRLIFGAELYGKIKYVSRVDRLWEYVRRNAGVELPEFVTEHDEEEWECKPVMDFGLESDHRRPVYDRHSSLSMYSMRCIS